MLDAERCVVTAGLNQGVELRVGRLLVQNQREHVNGHRRPLH